MNNLEKFGNIELNSNELLTIEGGHMSGGQYAASAAVILGAIFPPAGIIGAVGTAIACGGSL